MGNYNQQYESYYSGMVNKRKSGAYKAAKQESTWLPKVDGNYIVKKLTTHLIGVLILFLCVVACKVVVTPQTTAVYAYSKEMVGKNYNYTVLLKEVKAIQFSEIQKKATDFMDTIKSKLDGDKTIKQRISGEFMLPLEGSITSTFGYREDPMTKEKKFHSGIDIDAKLNTEVKASSDGRVKDCGEDVEFGKYIVVDHGQGIETKYAHLNEIIVKKEQAVKKAMSIGKSGNSGKSTAPHLHYEILYMGENKNPEEYFSILKK